MVTEVRPARARAVGTSDRLARPTMFWAGVVLEVVALVGLLAGVFASSANIWFLLGVYVLFVVLATVARQRGIGRLPEGSRAARVLQVARLVTVVGLSAVVVAAFIIRSGLGHLPASDPLILVSGWIVLLGLVGSVLSTVVEMVAPFLGDTTEQDVAARRTLNGTPASQAPDWMFNRASRILGVPVFDLQHRAVTTDVGPAHYFANPVRGGDALIISDDRQMLFASSVIDFDMHLQAFNNGRRTLPEELATI